MGMWSFKMFGEVIGHQKNIEMLQNALRNGRIARAYLFAGSVNLGKEFVAITFAKALNCLEAETDSCDKCISCRKIDDNNHPDVRVIRPDGAWMKIDQIRDLQKQISFRPMEGRYKVYILTDVERMTLQAANSFLKTLEEPPGSSVLILLTANYSGLLTTIQSRCRAGLLKFVPMPQAELAAWLMERYNLHHSRAKQIALLSGGKIGIVLETVQKDSIIVEPDVPEILKRPDIINTFRIAEELNDKQPESLDILLTWYRDLLLIKQGSPTETLTYSDKFNALIQLASGYSRIQLQDAIRTIMETKSLLRGNANTALAILAMEVMMLKLAGYPTFR